MQRIHEAASVENVASYIERQYSPILPIEGVLVQARFRQLSERQKELAKDLSEAMSQTSETWHDNAPADVANMASALNAASAEKVISAMRSSVVLDYPQSVKRGTLGNLFRIATEGDKTRSLFLAGYASDVKEYLKPGIDVVTLKSPVGNAILGAKAGATIDYHVGRRTLSIALDAIEPAIAAFEKDEFLHYDLERTS
jgi:transcription elongation GreA/GreB family factor